MTPTKTNKENVSLQTYAKQMPDRISWNRKGTIKEGILEHLEGQNNNGKSENINIYNRLSFSS